MVSKITLLEAHIDRTRSESLAATDDRTDDGKESLSDVERPADRSLGRMILDIGVLAFFLAVGFMMLRRDDSDAAEPIIIEDPSVE